MRKFENHEWISLALLSVIVPVSLLTAFRLSGVLKEPPTVEEITAETANWSLQRPKVATSLNDSAWNLYSDEDVSAELGIFGHYVENSGQYDHNDALLLGINVTVAAFDGFIYSMTVKFSRTDANAVLFVDETPFYIRLRNLRVQDIFEPATSESEAYFAAKSQDRPIDCSLQLFLHWIFFDVKNDANHRVNATVEIVYFNGALYRRAVLPISLEVLA